MFSFLELAEGHDRLANNHSDSDSAKILKGLEDMEWAVSSVVERGAHNAVVGGSIPSRPTNVPVAQR